MAAGARSVFVAAATWAAYRCARTGRFGDNDATSLPCTFRSMAIQ
jgi:hypothetical protein